MKNNLLEYKLAMAMNFIIKVLNQPMPDEEEFEMFIKNQKLQAEKTLSDMSELDRKQENK